MSDTAPTGYKVLARKYRPATFADLIGQEDMVRTLKNAFAADRIAHAFIMTGVRGVGKTTTARIIAKGLNCTGVDGRSGPTTEPCLRCDSCRAIAEGRHVDVIEMDGASQTRVDDIRNNVLDSVHYAPSAARYKVYIIDEVHMLSNSAFNALLKTLEEPPAHVKFIFATTEIRKVPVTVLSRCQRFDLRRIEPEVMMTHLAKVAELEGAVIAPDALALITRAAEGSVRDAMSLLDQAISHGAGETTADQVRAMLGLADRGRVLDLFDMVLKGDAAAALTELSGQYSDGADPIAVLRDLAEITHWVSVIKITPEAADDPTVAPDERSRGQAMAAVIPMRVLSRLWQMLLKSIEEVSAAPNAMMAAEMALIRMTHVADLPDPETLMRRLQGATGGPGGAGRGTAGMAGGAGGRGAGGGGAGPSAGPVSTGPAAVAASGSAAFAGTTTRALLGGPALNRVAGAGPAANLAVALAPVAAQAPQTRFEDVLDLIRRMRDVKLLVDVENGLRLVSYTPPQGEKAGHIVFEPAPGTPPDLVKVLPARLSGWTGQRWIAALASAGGAPTIAETRDAERNAAETDARADNPVVQAIFAAFPSARFEDTELARDIARDQEAEALPEVEDEWDPFEDG